MDQDGDVDMEAAGAEDRVTVAPAEVPALGAQVTTPPLSPTTALEGSEVATAPMPSVDPAAVSKDDEMDEGDTLDDSAIARDQGVAESEKEKGVADAAT